MTTKQNKRINAALAEWGIDTCVQAYILNVKRGEGGTVIETETKIPKRSQGAAIDAGKTIYDKRFPKPVKTDTAIPKFNPDLDIDENGNTNWQRADRAYYALECYALKVGHTPPRQGIDPSLVQDLMNDILHAMHVQGMDEVELERFTEIARHAHSGFLAESTPEEKVTL